MGKDTSKIVIKLGTRVVFDSRHKEIQREAIRSLAEGVSELLKQGNEIIIVSSGAVGCGQEIVKRDGSIGTKQARAAVGQIELMKEYSNIFWEFGLHIAQFLLNSNDLRSERLENIKRTYNSLGKGIVPIVNENDVTTTDELSFGDNDYLASEILNKFDFDTLLILTELGALIKNGEQVLESEKFDVDDYDNLSVNDGLGFGGLKSKLDVARIVVKQDKNFIIGKAEDSVVDILKHRIPATWFVRLC